MTQAPYGTWPSPLTAAHLADITRLGEIAFDTKGERVVWTERRGTKIAIMTADDSGDAPRVVSSLHGARGSLGYGGGDFTVHDGIVFFVSDTSGSLWRIGLDGGAARALTPPHGDCAAPVVSPDGRWVVYVHHGKDEVDRLAIVDSEGKLWPQSLTSGHDFYMQPRISPDGKHVMWIAWDHPNMPWDGTWVYVADLVSEIGGGLPYLGNVRSLAGGDDVAIFQPEFSADSRSIFYVSDETGWGQLWSQELAGGLRRRITQTESEHGDPAWGQGMRTYALSHDGKVAYVIDNKHGFARLGRVELSTGNTAVVDTLAGYSDVTYVAVSPSGKVALRGSSTNQPGRVVMWEPNSGALRILARSTSEEIPAERFARSEPLSWRCGNEAVHGFFYTPHAPDTTSKGKPPLLVMIHGGPTSQTRAGWHGEAQFFATRGFAVLQVNYRGSTGYGRAYMLKLRGQWGVADLEDAVSGAEHLARQGRVASERMVIMGGSAGGYTVLRALTETPDVFAAGINLYGLSNLFVTETHKFESRYNDSLVGVLPEDAARFRERSPVFFADRIKRPVAVFQGADDVVVPQEHSDLIVEALKRNKVPHIYHVYPGEGHGWRKRETIEHYYGAVEAFLREHVLFR